MKPTLSVFAILMLCLNFGCHSNSGKHSLKDNYNYIDASREAEDVRQAKGYVATEGSYPKQVLPSSPKNEIGLPQTAVAMTASLPVPVPVPVPAGNLSAHESGHEKIGRRGPPGPQGPQGPAGSDANIMPFAFTVFVGKNGDDNTADGSIARPFLTVQAAMEYAWTIYVAPVEPQSTSPFRRPVVFVSAGTYDDGPLVLPPQIMVEGEGFNHSRIIGAWSIDDRWSNYVPPSLPSPPSTLVPSDFRSGWLNVGLFGAVNIDFGPVFSNEGKLTATNVRFGGPVTFTEKVINPVSNSVLIFGGEFLDDVTLNGIPTSISNVLTQGGTLYINQLAGTGVDNIVQTSGGSIGNIVINSTSSAADAPIYKCTFGHSVQPGATLTLNGQFIEVSADISSIPLQSLIVLTGGATLGLIKQNNPGFFSGPTSDRPSSAYVGQPWFDTSLGKPIWWNGTNWIDADGNSV